MDYLATLRRRVGRTLIPLVYSTAIVADDAGRILFHHRPDFDVWGLPGGILEAGESPAECARREAFEETGLRVDVLRLAAVLSGPQHNVRYPNGDRVQQVTFFFVCRATGGSLRPAAGETTRLAFFPQESFPDTLPWYALALTHRGDPEPYFDPPEASAPAGQAVWSFLRSRVGPAPLVLPGASALIRDEHGRILLVRRADSGLWALPGGLLELGESLAGTAIRETEEETGLRVEPVRIRGAFGGRRTVFPAGDILYPIAAYFSCEVRSGSLRPDGKEIDRAEYHDPTRLPETAPGLRDRLNAIRSSPESAVFQ
ncbi:MAG: NUDIX domain-containing protein [Anaerolineales bacterium]